MTEMEGTLKTRRSLRSFFKPLIHYEALTQNPVILKELRSRMRSGRAFVLITLYLAAVGGMLALVYTGFLSSNNSVGGPDIRQTVGKTIFWLVSGLELMMVCFIAPALTSGAISSERERMTYDLLRTTLLSGRALIGGKYISSLTFILLLLVAALPFQSLASLFGGVAIEEVLLSFFILVVTAVAFSAIGIFYSSFIKRTLASTVVAYITAILMVFGVPALFSIMLAIFNSIMPGLSRQPGPIWERIIMILGWLLVSINPLSTVIATELMIVQKQNPFTYPLPLSNGTSFTVLGPWIGYGIIYLLISAILLLISIRFVSRMEK